jgi:hypothetical protein
MSDRVIEVLRRFAAKQATQDEAMRTLVEHDGWFVPALLMPGEHVVFDKAIMFEQTGRTPTRLWLFSDERYARAANEAAKGWAMGLYGGPVSGPDVFSLLREELGEVDVNQAAPRDETWFIGKGAHALARAWGDAVALERAFAGDPKIVAERVRTFPFMVAIAADRTPVHLPMGNMTCALAFTAPDRFDEFLAQLGPDKRAQVERATIYGRELCAQIPRLGVDGIIVNVSAPRERRFVLTQTFGKLVG